MSNQPRRHHYVPQFYLAGFTETGKPNGLIHVLDKQRGKTWPSNPNGVAHQRDFHAIDDANCDPMSVEKALSKLEGQWSAALRRVIEARCLPEDESFGDLMVFVAFMAVRVVRIRQTLADAMDRVTKSLIWTTLSTEQGRSQFREHLAAAGHPVTDKQFGDLVEFGQRGEYVVDYDQTWHVQQMIKMALVLAPVLSLRHWRLWPAEDEAPDLICSDNPVAPSWVTPMPALMSPAFGTPNTIVTIPLNKRIAIASMLETELPDVRLDAKGVAAVNTATACYANQIFSSTAEFIWLRKDGAIGKPEELLHVPADPKSSQD